MLELLFGIITTYPCSFRNLCEKLYFEFKFLSFSLTLMQSSEVSVFLVYSKFEVRGQNSLNHFHNQ